VEITGFRGKRCPVLCRKHYKVAILSRRLEQTLFDRGFPTLGSSKRHEASFVSGVIVSTNETNRAFNTLKYLQ